MNIINGKRVLVTGACGTVGSELIRQLLAFDIYNPKEVVAIDNSENALFYADQDYLHEPRINYLLADVRDANKVNEIMKGIDVVFHVAALKHVVLCERSPFEAVQTNIHGVQNIISAAQSNGVDRVIFTSTDKAVNPTNVMGTSKLMAERLVTAANSSSLNEGTIFSSTRFGNVLGSNGSVIPIFHKQIAKGGPVTLTHKSMSRFIMTIADSVRLVIDSASLARGGEVFITKMPIINICDLVEVMIEELAPRYNFRPNEIKVDVIGIKPGEKLYEELMSEEETGRALELERYFAVLPAFRGIYRNISYEFESLISNSVDNPYISKNLTALNKQQLRQYLIENELLDVSDKIYIHPQHRYWPGDK